jgi:sodium transport system ATP-binding protein
MPENAISIIRLTKKLTEVLAVDEISLEIPFGSVFGLLGPNGAGKTTTLRMLAGHLVPTSGQITVCGRRIPQELAEAKREIGFLSGGMELYERLTPRENLKVFARLREMRPDLQRRRIDELIAQLDMGSFCDRRFGQLSAGQKQRALIANTVIHDPRVLILDEITASLDIISSSFMMEFIRSARDRGKCIVFSTHVMSEAEYLCDRIALIYGGKIVGEGSARELITAEGAENLTEAFLRAIHRAPRKAG